MSGKTRPYPTGALPCQPNSLQKYKPLPPDASPERMLTYTLVLAMIKQTDGLGRELKQLKNGLERLYRLCLKEK